MERDMRNSAIATVLMICLALGACGKPAYWVKGLTLPPGSTVVNTTEMDTSSLMISFDNAAGWDSVRTHIDGAMQAQGYSDSLQDALSGLPAGMNPGGTDMMQGMRMYQKEGAEFTVSLQNMQAMKLPGGGELPGMGQFTLMVMRK
jgi:hypothetical protein